MDRKGWTLDPDVVMRRLRRMLWRFGGGSYEDLAFDAGFPFMFSNRDTFEEDLYERAGYIARYLRQKMKWVWNLDEEEARKWEDVVIKIIKSENGSPDTAAPPIAMRNPFGFGDYEGGG